MRSSLFILDKDENILRQGDYFRVINSSIDGMSIYGLGRIGRVVRIKLFKVGANKIEKIEVITKLVDSIDETLMLLNKGQAIENIVKLSEEEAMLEEI